MKKRLLSAALALAMMLTLLPLTAFAADTGPNENSIGPSGKTTVYYYERIQDTKLDKDNNPISGGWFYSYSTTQSGQTVTRYKKVDSGVINNANGQYDGASGTYYVWSDFYDGTNETVASTSFTLLGTGTYTISKLTQNITVDTNGQTLTVQNADMTKVTSVTIYDKQYYNYNGSTTQGSVSWNITHSDDNDKHANTQSFTLNVGANNNSGKLAGTVTLSNWATHTVNVTNGTVTGKITLSGKEDNSQAQDITATNATLDAIEVTGNSSHVNLTGVSAEDKAVGITGSSAHLTLAGAGSKIGVVTLKSGLIADKKTSAAPYATINGGTAASITLSANDDPCTSEFKVTVNRGGSVGAITATNAEKAAVEVNSGTLTGTTTLPNGSLKIAGSYANVGTVTLGGASKEVSLSVTGDHHTVGKIENIDGTAAISIPAEPTNNFDTLTLKTGATANRGIAGGTWATAPATTLLATTVKHIYMTAETNGKTTFYTAAQLGDALTAQKKLANSVLKTVNAPDTGSIAVTFKDGNANTLGELKCAPYESFALPTLIDGRTYSNWTDGNIDWPATSEYKAPGSSDDGEKLNAQTSSNMVTKISEISLASGTDNNVKYLTVSLSGNQISLSGAVAGSGAIKLKLKTNMGDIEVPAYYDENSNKLGWTNEKTLDGGMKIVMGSNGQLVLQLSNKTEYTLNNAGIKVPPTTLNIPMSKEGKLVVESISNSAAANDSDRTAIKNLITGSSTDTGKFAWGDVPAIEKAINRIKANITGDQVTTWRNNAQREAFTKHSTGTFDQKTNGVATGYDTVTLVPYLAVEVTDYKPNGSITMRLTPSYRIEITQKTAIDAWKLKGDAYPGGAYIALDKQRLGTLSDDFGTSGLVVTFAGLGNGSGTPFTNAHQDGTYVYGLNNKAITFTHPGTSGLGTVVINGTDALVKLYDKYTNTSGVAGSGTPKLYDTIQAAVNDTKPIDTTATGDTDDYIEVAQGYATGNVAISVTGLARRFYVRTLGNTKITSATSGGVLVDPDDTGHLYTVKLNQDTVAVEPVEGEVTITLATAAGGTATLSAPKVKPGTSVTVTLKPNTNYKANDVTVRTNLGTTLSASKSGDTWTFTVPKTEGLKSITVTPAFAQTSTLPFTDVATTDSYYEAVKWNWEHNYIKGTTPDNTIFAPNSDITRAQIVTILYRTMGSPSVNMALNPFTDLYNSRVTEEMRTAVVWAASVGIVNGYGDGTFGPNNTIRKQELAKILYVYNRVRQRPVTGSVNLNTLYVDGSQVSNWARTYVQWAVANKIIDDSSNGYYRPQTQLKRWETAVYVYNYGKQYGA